MNADRLLHAFSMIGEDPARIQQMRQVAVALAIGGKFSADAATLSPREMLRAVEQVKADLYKQRAIPKPKNPKSIEQDELPENFPDAGRFAPLGRVARVEKGLTGIKQAQPGPFPLVVTGAERATSDHFDFDGAAAIIPLVSSTGHGHASLNRLHYQEGKFALGTILAAVFPYDPALVSARFIFEYLSAFKEELLVTRMTGTANVTLSVGGIADVPIPLIDPSTQAKVDALMALLDRLEAARTAREATRDRLTAASLARLTAPDAPAEDFPANARFALATLPALTSRPDQIKPLRQTILNLAVRGKLVEQDPTDEPASELLKRIAKRRRELAAEEGVRKKKPVEPLAEEDELGLPANWAADAFANLIDPRATISYGVLVPGPDVDEGIPFVRAQDLMIADHPARPSKTIAPEVEAKYTRTRLNGGEILLCVVGSIGKLGIAPQHWAGANIARAVARIAPVDLLDRNYLLLFLRSDRAQGYFEEATRTLAQPTLNVGLIEKLPVPLPPLAEQHRIVAKVDALMALCDRLEAALRAADTTRARLLEALLADALNPASMQDMEAAE